MRYKSSNSLKPLILYTNLRNISQVGKIFQSGFVWVDVNNSIYDPAT